MNTPIFDLRHNRFEAAQQHPAFNHPQPWRDLHHRLGSDSPLLARFPARELQRRWLAGQAAIAVDRVQVVAYTSLIEVPLALDQNPVRVFEASSGWTMPGFRRKGLQVRMRRHLYQGHRDDLMISFCVGVGASFVLRRLGWQLYSWPDRLGVSDFIGQVDGGRLHHRLGDAIDLGGREPLRLGGPLDLDRHDWDRYLHLWVSDADRATRLRERILATTP